MTELEQQQQSIKTKIELLERDAHKVLKGGLDILDLGEQVARKVEGFNLEQKRRLLMIMMEDAEAKDGKVSYKISFPISLMFELSRGKHPSLNEIINYPFVYHIRHNSIAPEPETLRAMLS